MIVESVVGERSAVPSKRAVLKNHEFFRDLHDRVVDRLADRTRTADYAAGSQIFLKGDPGHGLMAVLSGAVKISVLSDEGKEIILNLIHSGQVFGEVALLDGHPRTADASAMTACRVLVLDRRDLLAVLTDEPAVAIKLLEVVSGRLRRTSQQLEELGFVGSTARLARTLLSLADGQPALAGPGDGRTPRVRVTQKELGQMIGLSRESTNRHLREWHEAGHIALEKGGVTILSRTALAAVAKADQA